MKYKSTKPYPVFHERTHTTHTCSHTVVRRGWSLVSDMLCISVPLSLLRTAHSCWPHLLTLATHGTMCDLQASPHLPPPSARLYQRENPLPPPHDVNPSSPFLHLSLSLPPSLPLPSLSSPSLLHPHPPPPGGCSLQLVLSMQVYIHGAYYNILTNLVTDSSYATSVREEAARLAGESTDKCLSLLDTIQLGLEAAAQKSGGGAT